MIWYIDDPLKHRSERLALEALAASAPWLTPGEWRVDTSLRLLFDATIHTGDVAFDVTLRYPAHFPHSPVLVVPTNKTDVRWSAHQWGAGGELCLEWGTDNWHPDVTGAMMLESAERLLRGERPEAGGAGDVPSRHNMTLGQDIRNSALRFMMTDRLKTAFAAVPPGMVSAGKLIVHIRERKCIYVVREVTGPGGVAEDMGVPAPLVDEGWEKAMPIYRLAPDQPLPRAGTLTGFRTTLEAQGFTPGDETYCVVLKGDDVYPFLLWADDDTATAITVIPASEPHRRLDESHDSLAGKKVALIGCGSLGSKIATSLARCGVGAFYLVDDDLVLPENLVRHDLDWREVGYAKADALSRRIRLANPAAVVQTRLHRIGGQEASGSIESVIEAIAACDIILDCTADPKVFSYLCAAMAVGKKPMVWAEVFGGGIGGLIARHRPGLDPDPATMRAIIEQACRDHGKPAVRSGGRYDQEAGDGPPLIADDADVSVIAAHATRLAVDTMLARAPSMFPVSAYLVGLSEGFIFSQPFETWPIDVGQPKVVPEEDVELPPGVAEEELAIVRALFEKLANASDRT